MNDKPKEIRADTEAHPPSPGKQTEGAAPEVTIDIIRLDGRQVDIRPPESRNSKYDLMALALMLFAFVGIIGYSFYRTQATSLVTIALPLGSELYYKKELLQHVQKPGADTIVYARRLPNGRHTFTAIDVDKKEYTLQFELAKGENQSRTYILSNGSFLRF